MRILNAVDCIQDGIGASWGTHGVEETGVKYFNGITEGQSTFEENMCIRNDNIKVGFTDTNLVSHLIYLSYQKGKIWNFEKSM